jgi:hypothetical protein
VLLKLRLAVEEEPVHSLNEDMLCLYNTLLTQCKGHITQLILQHFYRLTEVVNSEFVHFIYYFLGLGTVLGREVLHIEFQSSHLSCLQDRLLLAFLNLLRLSHFNTVPFCKLLTGRRGESRMHLLVGNAQGLIDLLGDLGYPVLRQLVDEIFNHGSRVSSLKRKFECDD